MNPDMEIIKGCMCHLFMQADLDNDDVGSIPVFDEIIVSTENMKTIRKFDELRGK